MDGVSWALSGRGLFVNFRTEDSDHHLFRQEGGHFSKPAASFVAIKCKNLNFSRPRILGWLSPSDLYDYFGVRSMCFYIFYWPLAFPCSNSWTCSRDSKKLLLLLVVWIPFTWSLRVLSCTLCKLALPCFVLDPSVPRMWRTSFFGTCLTLVEEDSREYRLKLYSSLLQKIFIFFWRISSSCG